MALDESSILMFLKRDSLEIFYDGESRDLDYPPHLVKNLEISDVADFEKLTAQILARITVDKGQVLIVLSDEIVTFDERKGKKSDDSNVAVKKILEEDKVKFISVNKSFYTPVMKALEDKGFSVEAVVPALVFKEKLKIAMEALDTETARKILSKKDLIEVSNFLSNEDGKIVPSIFQRSFPSIYLVIFGILLVSSVSILGAVSFGLFDNANEIQIVQVSRPAISPVVLGATPSAKEAFESGRLKSELTIQVLNGSGIAAQAGKTKRLLEDLGFGNIKVGNDPEYKGVETKVSFSGQVLAKESKEILKKLQEVFQKVIVENGVNLEFDVVITTGEYQR